MFTNVQDNGLQYQRKEISKDRLTNKNPNIIEIKTTQSSNGHHASSINTYESGSLNNKKTIAYSADALKIIGTKLQHDQCLRIMP